MPILVSRCFLAWGSGRINRLHVCTTNIYEDISSGDLAFTFELLP